jgi:hypothetical protein
MRILKWSKITRELDSSAAFNIALLKALDPRLITHRPRDPEKERLMKELGIVTEIKDFECKVKPDRRKGSRRPVKASWDETEMEIDLDDAE